MLLQRIFTAHNLSIADVYFKVQYNFEKLGEETWEKILNSKTFLQYKEI